MSDSRNKLETEDEKRKNEYLPKVPGWQGLVAGSHDSAKCTIIGDSLNPFSPGPIASNVFLVPPKRSQDPKDENSNASVPAFPNKTS